MKKFAMLFFVVLFFVSCKTMPEHKGAELTIGNDKLVLSEGKVFIFDQHLTFYQNGYELKVQKDSIKDMDIKYK